MLGRYNSRAIERITGKSKNTVSKLLSDAGRACGEYQDRALRDLERKCVEVYEIWSFTHAEQKNLGGATPAMAAGITNEL